MLSYAWSKIPEVRLVQIMPSGEVKMLVPPTATNRPLPYVTPFRSICVPELAAIHVTASDEVRTRPASPTATKEPFPYVTAVNKPGAPESAGFQETPSLELRMLALPKKSTSPTATKVPLPYVTAFSSAADPEFALVQFVPAEYRITPDAPTATKVPLP